MNMVLIHIGESLPDYFWQSAEQARRFFPGHIHVILPEKYVSVNSIRRIGLHPVSCEKIFKNAFYKRFIKACTLESFWNVTMGRLIMLQILMMEKFLTDVVHIENDVLIYTNPLNHVQSFRQVAADTVLMCPVGQNHASAAYLYVKNFLVMNKLNALFINYFERGPEFIKKNLGNEVSEMTMMAHFQRERRNIVRYLPIMPEGIGSENFKMFNSIFDGASAGQFVGGTQSDPPGWCGLHHYLGRDLLKHKYSFEWRKENNLRIPHMKMGKKSYRMNNLHIHCKKLKEFM